MGLEVSERDIRHTQVFGDVRDFYQQMRRPGSGKISDAAHIDVSPDGGTAVFSGTIMDSLVGTPSTRVCAVELKSGEVRVLSNGPHVDRLPRYSPDGQAMAFVSDSHGVGDFQLYILDLVTGLSRAACAVDGWVEYLEWSPNGAHILLGVAGHGADVAGAQGAVPSRRVRTDLQSWMPDVQIGAEDFSWRRIWIYNLHSNTVREVGEFKGNIWEAAWCGNTAVVAVTSSGPSEGHWYAAKLGVIEISDGSHCVLYAPNDQLGGPAASPSGRRVAVIEAVCSDRGVIAGDVRLIDAGTAAVLELNIGGVDAIQVEWLSEQRLLVAGYCGPLSVVGVYDAASGTFTRAWESRETSFSTAGRAVSGLNEAGDCVMVVEGFRTSPEIATVDRTGSRRVVSFDLGYESRAAAMHRVEHVDWLAGDGVEIHGWLLLPEGPGPHPVVMSLHGGPVFHHRPHWLGRHGASVMLSLERGTAIFLPNPRGSSGRGQDFARRVVCDMGGADAQDCLTGLDRLVERGIADPDRIALTGVSYGGFMTSWLTTQDMRFRAAAAIAPINNWVSERFTSNIPHFVRAFCAAAYNAIGGQHFERSPIMHAERVRTATLQICGGLDRCTPPTEALQFHNALLENNVTSALVTYPEEGHGIRSFPAMIDSTARILGWFEEHGCLAPDWRLKKAATSQDKLADQMSVTSCNLGDER
jgi:dipeptidyl aminopeptidase/acylaminoacyl peptidase